MRPSCLWTGQMQAGQVEGMAARTSKSELVIVGGGMVGMTLAAATSSAGIATTLIEAESIHDLAAAKFDGRSSAIAFGSKQVLAATGAWRYLEQDAAPIREIRVSDGGWRQLLNAAHESPFFV